MIGPKETAYLNMLDPYNQKPNIQWNYYEGQD